MDVPDHTAADDACATAVETGSNLFERTILSVLALLAAGCHCIVLMLVAPRIFARRVVEDSSQLPPPYSFLLASLMLGGISIQTAVAFFGQPVDHAILERLATAVSSITLEDLFVLTVPCIILVAMAGAGVARWTLPQTPFQRNAVVRAMCYAGGLQFTLIGAACMAGLLIKFARSSSSVMAESQFDQAVFLGLGYLIIAAALPVFHVIRLSGTTFWARHLLTALPLSLLACTTVLVGMSITNSISFDLKSAVEEVRMAHQRTMLDDFSIGIRSLSSRMIRDQQGRPQIDMTVAMVNVSDQAVIVPRPFELQHAMEPQLAPILVADGPATDPENAGWIIEPGQTKLARWQLEVPPWLADPDRRSVGLPVCLACFPLNGVDDLLNTHPVGDPMIVLGSLSWPMTDAIGDQDRPRAERIAEMLNDAAVR